MKRSLHFFVTVVFVFFFSFIFTMAYGQTYNLCTKGDMENNTWTAVPGNTNMTATYDVGSGIGGTKSYKTVASSMGGDPYYIFRCDESIPLTNNTKVEVSFWAKGSVAGMRVQSFVQKSTTPFPIQLFGDAYVTTTWQKYQFTVTLAQITASDYNVKFRGYNVGTLYIDNVQIGPVDYENVAQSGIYEVTVSQNSMLWPINVFKNACPAYSAGYQNMDPNDQHPLDLFAGRSINWTKLSTSYPLVVHVKVNDIAKVPVSGQTVRILPTRYGISSTTAGNVVTFTITQPGQYSVEIGANGYKNGLMIFADPVETDIPSQVDPNYLVLYNATAANISSIPSNYTGVYFRRGVHDVGIFTIPSYIKNIYFEDGAWVYGALYMSGNSNVRIYGRGVLSSNNFNYRQTHCVNAENGSNNIILEGLVVADPKYYGIRLVGTHNTVNYSKVIGGWVYNCDGIAAYDGSTVSKSFIWANDDAIKAYRDSLTWSDIVVWQLNNGGTIQTSWGGAPGGSTSKGVKISRVDVLRAEWDVDRFNVGLLGCIGNHYKDDLTKSDLLQDWLIEDVITENDVPLVFNITPEPASTHVHIHGMTLKNWDVHQNNALGFVNEIIGEDSNDYLSGFVFDNVKFNNGLMTNENRIPSGEMDNGGWIASANGTDQVVTLGSTYGTGSGWGLRSVTTNMNSKPSYTIVATQPFHIDNNEVITISYWAKATAAGKLLLPFVQDATSLQYKDFTQVSLTTNYVRYSSTFTVDKITSDNYQIKFKAFATAWIYLDKVQVGRKDWLTLTGISKLYLNTPTFLPLLGFRKAASSPTSQTANPISSIKPVIQREISIYPNPVSDILLISGVDRESRYTIYDQIGNLISTGNGQQVHVSNLNKGSYIILINNKKLRFIKE